MKILRIIARLNVGGPARHVALLDAGLRARGHDTLLVHGAPGNDEASLEHLAKDLGVPMVYEPHLGRRLQPASDLLAFAALLRRAFRERPDVVHTHTSKAGTLGRAAAFVYNACRPRGRRAVVVHMYHGHVFEGYFTPRVSALVQAVERMLARGTDCIVTLSPRQQRDIVERFHVAPASKVHIVRLGLHLDPLLAAPASAPDARAAIGVGADDVAVGFSGRMVPIKDLPTLMHAFTLAHASVPALRLVLAGDGPERAQLEALARELGVSERVRFLGWVDDMPSFYALIDICALSSLNEGTPVAAIEAMAAAKPVVSTDVGGVADVVEHGGSGLLVPAGDVRAMAAALVQLASDRVARERLGQAGRRLAAGRYCDGRLVEEVERLYRTALEAKRGRGAA